MAPIRDIGSSDEVLERFPKGFGFGNQIPWFWELWEPRRTPVLGTCKNHYIEVSESSRSRRRRNVSASMLRCRK